MAQLAGPLSPGEVRGRQCHGNLTIVNDVAYGGADRVRFQERHRSGRGACAAEHDDDDDGGDGDDVENTDNAATVRRVAAGPGTSFAHIDSLRTAQHTA